MRVIFALILFVLAVAPVDLWAQSSQAPACDLVAGLSSECKKEFDQWQKAEMKWRKWLSLHGNYTVGGKKNDYTFQPHPTRPVPPEWLALACDSVDTFLMGGFCAKYLEARNFDYLPLLLAPGPVITSSIKTLVSQGESMGIREWFLKSVHYDAAWTNSSNGPRTYGFFGAHVTLANVGRVYLWGPPGVMVIRDPDGAMHVRYSWGGDILLGNLPVPFSSKYVRAYLTLAKVFANTAQVSQIFSAPHTGRDMAGFSITLR